MVQRKLDGLMKSIEGELNQVRDEFLKNIAEDLVRATPKGVPDGSPVDTGAYMSSHSITTTRGAGRGRTSHGKAPNKDPQAASAEALSALMGDISSLPNEALAIYIANNSPHASRVEYGGWAKIGPYAVYTGVRERAGLHLAAAVAKVRGST